MSKYFNKTNLTDSFKLLYKLHFLFVSFVFFIYIF